MYIKFVDSFLNSITMYKLILYSLVVLCVISFSYSLLGLLPFSFSQLGITIGIIFTTGFLAKKIAILIFKPLTNFESDIITSLILFFILAPVASFSDVWITIAASLLAVFSKYLLAIDKKHIFNPAAIAVFLLGLLGFGNAIWWVGSSVLLPFVVILGFLLVRKIRRFHLLMSFIGAAVISLIFFNLRNGVMPYISLSQIFLSYPLLFLGTVMLTEPMTSPTRKNYSIVYGVIVGVLFGSQFHIGPLFSSPEFSLIVGNIFAYVVSPKYKLFLHLKEKVALAPEIWEFVFDKVQPFSFLPGQYLEWTIPGKMVDSRGNRRYFTIASSPTEQTLKIGVKLAGDSTSSFKKTLQSMSEGTIVATQLSGDFILPTDSKKKLVFMAGGIGVTPFRSMIQYLLDIKEPRDIILFYVCSKEEEFVYKEIFSKARERIGLKVIYVITHPESASSNWKGEIGYITGEMLRKYIPNISERRYYLSGPNAMVEGYKKLLITNGIERKNIILDYFPGF